MQKLRHYHRWATILIVLFAFYLGATGTTIQLVDLTSIYGGAPATDPNVKAMRESFDGPANYAVRKTSDYLAAPLPDSRLYPSMLDRVLIAARQRLGAVPFDYVELRMAGQRPVGQIGLGAGHAQFDALSGALLEHTATDVAEPPSPASLRNTVKSLHRMTSFGDWALFINVGVATGLAVLIVTGSLMYFKLLQQRRKIKRPSLFWSAGGTWRTLHRAVSLACAAFLVVVTLSGGWLAVESLYRSFDVLREQKLPPVPVAPLDDAAARAMLAVTMKAIDTNASGDPVKVVRLRNFGGYRQGVVVTGGSASRQLVFNARTGAAMTETEPGYPRVHFPFGWQAHQWAKSVHRGDMIGLTGRWMDLIAGFALIYLSLSGGVMYWTMWRRRRQTGRPALVWK